MEGPPMLVDPRLSRQLALLLSPVLLVQARKMRRVIPRLPDAGGDWHGGIDGPDPLRILVLGDSTAAGVGAETQDDALPGNLARTLHKHWGRGSTWNAIGENGATARDIIERFLAGATHERYDLVFLSIGANDALHIRSRGAFARDVRTILRALRSVSPDALILVSSLPAFFRFRSLPNPLRWVLYLHSSSLEAAARRIVAHEPAVIMSPPPPPYTDGFFASDEFHPSAIGYRDWVEFALEDSGLIVPNEPGTLDEAAIAEASGTALSGTASSESVPSESASSESVPSEAVSSESVSSDSVSPELVDDAGEPSADATVRP
jgi:lysophospholipase L1-like esterase